MPHSVQSYSAYQRVRSHILIQDLHENTPSNSLTPFRLATIAKYLHCGENRSSVAGEKLFCNHLVEQALILQNTRLMFMAMLVVKGAMSRIGRCEKMDDCIFRGGDDDDVRFSRQRLLVVFDCLTTTIVPRISPLYGIVIKVCHYTTLETRVLKPRSTRLPIVDWQRS